MAYTLPYDEPSYPATLFEEPSADYGSSATSTERNTQMRLAWQIAELTSRNLFLTGKAGTGKTTFLKTLREHTTKRMIVLAPTGIAAINAGGVTIHSFFQFPLSPYIPGVGFPESKRRFDRFTRDKLRIIKTVDTIVIDEISMVRADILDAVDAALRRHRDPRLPFGGVQLLLIGDLQQLAPVVKPSEWTLLGEHYDTPFFFSSLALQEAGFDTIELQHIYRQSDSRFIELLNRVRTNTADADTLRQLNQRYIPNFNPDESEGYIRLTTHNRQAQEINDAALARLSTTASHFEATVKGEFPEIAYPTDKTLTLKEGAQVMFLRNDAAKGYYNGMMGRITHIAPDAITVRPHGSDENLIVEPATWENSRYGIDSSTGAIREEIVGSFQQYPLRLAWAITIHKSQGLTFEKAIIDASGSFAHGQTYVALSRCKSLEGMVLDRLLSSSAIISDRNVVSFIDTHCSRQPSQQQIEQMKTAYVVKCLDELFGTATLRRSFDALLRIIDEFLSRDYPSLCSRYHHALTSVVEPLEKVSSAFSRQYRSLSTNRDALQERIDKAIPYFLDALQPLVDLLRDTPTSTSNKAVTTRLSTAVTDLAETLAVKRNVMKSLQTIPFSPKAYMKEKAQITLRLADLQAPGATPAKPAAQAKPSKTKIDTAAQTANIDQKLLQALINWRTAEKDEQNVPAFVILTNKVIEALAIIRPTTPDQLLQVPGIGKAKLDLYGPQLLQIIKDYSPQ